MTMQSLEVISVNIWQILISLLNLIILFFIIKKFLFKPVTKMLSKRQNEIDEIYGEADESRRAAEKNKLFWDEKITSVKEETDEMLKAAHESAKKQSESIVSKAKEQAGVIVRLAENQAKLEKKKAEAEIKQEIVEVSTALANKLLEREINLADHRYLINSFIEKIGDENE